MNNGGHQMKNVLLYLGKFPGYGFDVDGGSILARQLIDSLKLHCNLTVVFIRKNGETFSDPFVKEIRYVDYKNPFGNKFLRRLQNLDTNRDAIGSFMDYDTIITAHVSKFFGFEKAPADFWRKTILFPMFCTNSYKRAGEEVPLEYTHMEQFVLHRVNRIITPSEIEKEELCSDYGLDVTKMSVVYRGINPVFTPTDRKHRLDNPKIVCIGSIKRQKNNLQSLRLLDLLVRKGIDASLNIVCTIQDNNIYKEMIEAIHRWDLTQRVHFYFEQSQEQVAEIVQGSDINISVSHWETFGRGIFEGVSCGLPTFVPAQLTGVRLICRGNKGVCFVKDVNNMAMEIERIIKNPIRYNQMVQSLKSLADRVSYENERTKLVDIIL